MATAATLKRSRQREAIVSFLKTRTDHPTADTIYQEIRREIPNISLGTVYRNLSLLADRGEILRLSCDGKMDRFDADITPHYHFICRECGCVKDITIPYNPSIDALANQYFDGSITNHILLYEGYCINCQKKECCSKP